MAKTKTEITVEDSRATFIIQGTGLDLDAISRIISIVPTHTHRIGELSRFKKALPHDMWSLTSPLDRKEPLDAHLKWLDSQLEPHYDFIKSLKPTADVYIVCGYTTNKEQCGFSLSPEALAIFAKLGISMEVNILCT
jgi:hypothetical protein